MSSRFQKHIVDILTKLDLREPEPGRKLRESAIYNAAKRAGVTDGLRTFMLGELKVAGLF
jgi:hypothetical protein